MIRDLGPAPELGVDLETYPQDETARSLDPRRGSVGVISLASRDATYVIDRKALAAGEVRKALQEILSEKTFVAHSAPFDLAFLRRDVGYEHNGPVHDTLVLDGMLFYATGPLTEKDAWRGFVQKDKEGGYKKALADVTRERLGVELEKGTREADWGGELSEEMVAYAASDASVLLPLKDALVSELEALGMGAVVDLEARFTPSMAYCSDNGFGLDVDGWRRHADEAARRLEEARKTCDALAPDPPAVGWEWAWSASNHRKVGRALEMLGAKVEKKVGTGNYITGEAALKAIKRPKEARELAAAILAYREHEKFVTTWGNSWFREPETVSKGKTKGRIKQGSPGHLQVVNGRVHTKLNQLVATGRGSSRPPQPTEPASGPPEVLHRAPRAQTSRRRLLASGVCRCRLRRRR
jgi:DNA polymerase I-like protein with 3'-5' exonuclease and polymerase domains